jgi:hypothetical protein
VGEDIIEVRDQRPVAMVLHDNVPTVHNLMTIDLLIVERIRDRNLTHHVLETDDHDVEEAHLFGHSES